jgi:hypothetical protein
LQEVDHFHDYFSPKLKAHGYSGTFLAKPDSPCLRVPGHTSPDGCAVFVKESRLEVKQMQEVLLKDDRSLASNQVAIIVMLNDLQTNRKFLAAVTHLKAKEGNEKTRLAQGKDLLVNLRQMKCGMGNGEVLPILVGDDFNATPDEPIYQEMLDNGLNSSYLSAAKHEAIRLRHANSGQKGKCATQSIMCGILRNLLHGISLRFLQRILLERQRCQVLIFHPIIYHLFLTLKCSVNEWNFKRICHWNILSLIN